jgi:hypothetical protein
MRRRPKMAKIVEKIDLDSPNLASVQFQLVTDQPKTWSFGCGWYAIDNNDTRHRDRELITAAIKAKVGDYWPDW